MSQQGSKVKHTTRPRCTRQSNVRSLQSLLALCQDRDLRVVTLFPDMLGGLGSDRGLLCRDRDFLALCRNRNLVLGQVLGLGQAWVATKVSLCRDKVFPGVGHSCRDRRLDVAIEIPRVVLRHNVFLTRPIGQARTRDRALDVHDRPRLPTR